MSNMQRRISTGGTSSSRRRGPSSPNWTCTRTSRGTSNTAPATLLSARKPVRASGHRREGHVRAATAEIIKKHYDRWYHPNNAVWSWPAVRREGCTRNHQEALRPRSEGGIAAPQAGAEQKPRTETVRKKSTQVPHPAPAVRVPIRSAAHADSIPLDVVATIVPPARRAGCTPLIEDDGTATSSSQPICPAAIRLVRGPSRAVQGEELNKSRDDPRGDPEAGDRGPDRGGAEAGTAGDDGGTHLAHESVHELADTIARGVRTQDLEFIRRYLPDLLKVSAATSSAWPRSTWWTRSLSSSNQSPSTKPRSVVGQASRLPKPRGKRDACPTAGKPPPRAAPTST